MNSAESCGTNAEKVHESNMVIDSIEFQLRKTNPKSDRNFILSWGTLRTTSNQGEQNATDRQADGRDGLEALEMFGT